jgi:hypothetical protein
MVSFTLRPLYLLKRNSHYIEGKKGFRTDLDVVMETELLLLPDIEPLLIGPQFVLFL